MLGWVGLAARNDFDHFSNDKSHLKERTIKSRKILLEKSRIKPASALHGDRHYKELIMLLKLIRFQMFRLGRRVLSTI